MSRNGSGTYTKVGGDAVFDTVISETYFNAQIDDMVTALTGSVAADGQTPVTGNIAMGTNKLTGLGAGSAATDSTNLGTVQAGAYANTLADTGAADAYVITPSPAITAYAAGQRFSFIAANASTGASTVNVSGLGTKAVEYQSVALTGAEIKATSTIVIEYDGTAFQMISPSNLLSATAGDVVGPASATDNSLAKFDGTTGKLLKDGAVIGTDVQAYDADTLKADVDDVLTGGFQGTDDADGTKTTGTYTPTYAGGNFKSFVHGAGAFTLAPQSGTGTLVLHMTNASASGTVTTSGFTIVSGDTIDQTGTNKFLLYSTVTAAQSHLHVVAMQ
jgi:hypothetical protein